MNELDIVPPTIADQEPSLFFANLPNSTSAFELTTLSETGYFDFYNAVYSQQHIGPVQPYRFGSYQIYQADGLNQNWQVNVQMNLTS
jgi:hypothetical protein